MVYRFEGFIFDETKSVISIKGKEFKLTKTQNKLLAYFIAHPHEITSKQQLMEQVWGRIVTENSVDQIISILRNYLEKNPSKPQIIITHYGQGLSFEGKKCIDFEGGAKPEKSKSQQNPNTWLLLIIPIAIGLALLFQSLSEQKVSKTVVNSVQEKSKKLLILPMTFSDESINEIDKKGMKSAIKTTFNNLETEGDLIFDESSLTTQQAVEKHWKIEDELIVLQSNVVKNGNIYEATIELSNGINYHETKTLSAPSLENLLDKQVSLIAQIQDKKVSTPINSLYLHALGEFKSNHFSESKRLLKQLLMEKEDFHQARLLLAEALITLKEYDDALSQLKTLKATNGYEKYSTEIELKLAEIKLLKNQYQDVIDDLKNYQISHLNINEIKKAKIQLSLGKAYISLGDSRNAMLAYKQALTTVDELINPKIYAQSYLGQADILNKNANDNKVYAVYNKAYDYAKSAADLRLQALALGAMATIKVVQNEWQKAIELTKKSIQVMELTENKDEIAKGLSNLVTILNLRGQISEARAVNNRLGKIAEDINSDSLRLYFLHFDAILDMNQYKFSRAQEQIDKQLIIAKKISDYRMILNNAFIQLELLLLKKDTKTFKRVWDERSAMIKENGYEHYQVYMNLFLGRYFKQLHQDDKAIELLSQVSEQVKVQKDMKMFTDAQNQLAEVYLESNPNKSLAILNNLEQYNPHPNPYLDLKAAALHKLGKNIEALSVLNKAKLIYHEGWTAENQKLLELIKTSLE